MAAVCWKDDIVIFQHSALVKWVLLYSNIHTEVQEFTKQVHILALISQSPCIQCGEGLSSNPFTLLTIDYGMGIFGGEDAVWHVSGSLCRAQ